MTLSRDTGGGFAVFGEQWMRRAASLPIFMEERGTRTLQDQIYHCILRSILDGLVGADRRLPSTRALSADLGVSRTTALLALERLRAEGYVVARLGVGMFIAPLVAGTACRCSVPPLGQTRFPSSIFTPGLRTLPRTRAPDRRAHSTVSPCAFRLGTPALDLFPWRTWSQITRECLLRVEAVAARLFATGRTSATCVRQSRSRCSHAAHVAMPTRSRWSMGAQRGLDLIAHMLLDPGRLAAWMEDPEYTGARGALARPPART